MSVLPDLLQTQAEYVWRLKCMSRLHPSSRTFGRVTPKNPVDSIPNLAQPWTFIVTKKNDMYRVEIKINVMKRNGTESWVVINRSVGRYVTELNLGHYDPANSDQHITSSGKREHGSSRINALLPMEQRKWEHTSGVQRVDDACYLVQKKR